MRSSSYDGNFDVVIVIEKGEERRRMDKKHYEKGYRRELLEILLSVGIIPCRTLKFLDGQQSSYTRTLKKMEEEGICELKKIGEYRKKKRVYVLRNFEKKQEGYVNLSCEP